LSRSRHFQKVILDSQENLNPFKKLILTIKISQSRSRFLDFVLTAKYKSVIFYFYGFLNYFLILIVRGLNDAVPRLIGLVLRPRSVRLVPDVLSGI
jgi:hypothetical protein